MYREIDLQTALLKAFDDETVIGIPNAIPKSTTLTVVNLAEYVKSFRKYRFVIQTDEEVDNVQRS